MLLIGCASAHAEFSRDINYKPRTDTSRFEQRKLYQDALYLIKSGQRSRYRKIAPQLEAYPLYPYLAYTDKIYHLSSQSTEDIVAFIDQYQDTPLSGQLRQNWLFSLARRGQWETFLNFYDEAEAGERNACFYGIALYNQGRLAEAMAQAERLWLVGRSQPEECDPVFKFWRDNKGLTADLAWQRYALAVKAREAKLAAYLIRFLDKSDKSDANNLKLVHAQPGNILRYTRFDNQRSHAGEVILHGVKQLAQRDPASALIALNHYVAVREIDPAEVAEAYVYIGIRIAQSGDEKNQLETIPLDLNAYPELVAARIRLALRRSDWSDVLILINLLPAEDEQHANWQYWKASVLASSGDSADQEIARSIFVDLASQRSFHGFLSADRLGLNYNFVDEPSTVSTEEILALETTPGIQRALELLTLNERSRARREWYFTTRDFSNTERQIAARVAQRWGWYKPAIQSLIDAKAWNDLDFRFPIAYQETFISNARAADIPVYWSLAIARQESAFMPDAKSPSGAYGLMQLMPATARIMAQRTGASLQSNQQLIDPDLNIKLGSQYLGRMLRRYDNNRILASAAYNAGPGNVDKWLDPDLDFDVWIETIPFRETREYVKNVLMFSTIYGRRMHQEQPLIYSHELAQFKPRSAPETIEVAAPESRVRVTSDELHRPAAVADAR